MGIAISILLIAAGAILDFAVSKTVDGLALGTVGVILMIVGGVGLVISLVMAATARSRDGSTTVVQGATPAAGGTTVLQEGGR